MTKTIRKSAADEYIEDYDLVAKFRATIRSHALGLAETRDALYRSVLDDTDDTMFADQVVTRVTALSGCEGWRYDW